MSADEITNVKHWRDKRSGQIVVVLFPVKVKSPVTNSWFDGVAYRNGVDVFVRTTIDFLDCYEDYKLLYDDEKEVMWP